MRSEQTWRMLSSSPLTCSWMVGMLSPPAVTVLWSNSANSSSRHYTDDTLKHVTKWTCQMSISMWCLLLHTQQTQVLLMKSSHNGRQLSTVLGCRMVSADDFTTTQPSLNEYAINAALKQTKNLMYFCDKSHTLESWLRSWLTVLHVSVEISHKWRVSDFNADEPRAAV